eukprot:2028519-Rhodomonas_salina.1
MTRLLRGARICKKQSCERCGLGCARDGREERRALDVDHARADGCGCERGVAGVDDRHCSVSSRPQRHRLAQLHTLLRIRAYCVSLDIIGERNVPEVGRI